MDDEEAIIARKDRKEACRLLNELRDAKRYSKDPSELKKIIEKKEQKVRKAR